MQKREWYNFINDQLNEKFTLIEEIVNLQNMNYDFAASGKIEGESIRIQVDDENFDDDIVIDRKEVYLQCVSNDLTPEEAIKKIIEMKIKEK